ncbi:MAG: hypothetical protein NTX03_09500 [Bacteroidetes bacterium]|nr:hypothetical protein [Bacteroidota bacterium]
MKKQITLLSVLFSMAVMPLFAKVITVSNDNGKPAQYKDIASAISAASNGDTLYVTGSSTSYGSIAITKSLTLIGQGHHPANGFQKPSIIKSINIQADDVSIIGFAIAETVQSFRNSNHLDPVKNIRFERNEMKGTLITGDSAKNWIIDNNFFYNRSLRPDTNFKYITTCSNILIYNNYFNFCDIFLFANGISIRNNIFYRATIEYVKFATIENNIIYKGYLNHNGALDNCKFNNILRLRMMLLKHLLLMIP